MTQKMRYKIELTFCLDNKGKRAKNAVKVTGWGVV